MGNWKLLFKKLEKTFLFIIKALMILSLFIAFFGLFSFQVPQLTTINRTSMVSFVTFAIATVLFIRIYGGFPIGARRSREIANTMMLAVFMGDFITFIVVYIMGVTTAQYSDFAGDMMQMLPPPVEVPFSQFLSYYFAHEILPGLGMLVLVLVIQFFLVRFFTYMANSLYFKINEPKPVLVVYTDQGQLPMIIHKIERYRTRWCVNEMAPYDAPDIKKYIRNNGVIFFFDVPKNERASLMEYCYKHNKDIFLLPDVSDIILNHAAHFVVDDTTMFASTTRGMSFEQLVIKRVCDVIFSMFFLILTSPIFLVVSIAIKLGDRGPIFYKQARLTKGGREFYLLKFRSMVVDAEKDTGAVLAREKDTRVTSVGKVLRRFRMDELPQLLNILKGDMSIVGPRPERPEIAEEYGKELPEFRYRLKVKAGLTGLAQIMSKYNTTPKDKLALDLEYIARYSIWLDIKLILRTVLVFIKPDSTQGVTSVEEDEDFIKHETLNQKDGESDK